MYCSDFTAVYDRTNFPNKILFAGQKYDLYQNDILFQKVYIDKFYIQNDQIRFKFYKFGQRTKQTGYYNNLICNYKKTKTYKLTNFTSIRDFLKERDLKLNDRRNDT